MATLVGHSSVTANGSLNSEVDTYCMVTKALLSESWTAEVKVEYNVRSSVPLCPISNTREVISVHVKCIGPVRVESLPKQSGWNMYKAGCRNRKVMYKAVCGEQKMIYKAVCGNRK